MTGALKQIWNDVAGLWSLVVGLKVTGSYFFRPQVTVHYPRRTVDNLASFRGPIELAPNPDDPDRPRCIACMTCVTVCPGGCISVTKQKKAEGSTPGRPDADAGAVDKTAPKKAPKGPSLFIYDYTLCSLCGLCAENCPVHALRFSNRAYLAGTDKKAFIFNLLEQFAEAQKAQETGRIISQQSDGQ
jgi:NADH-quinone oxidoreductase subunit I